MNVYDKINTGCEPQVNLLGLIVLKRQTKDPAQQVLRSSYSSIVASSLHAYSVLFAARDKSMNGNGNGKKVRATKTWHNAGAMESVGILGMVHWRFGVRCMLAVGRGRCFWCRDSFRDFIFFFRNTFSTLSTVVSAIAQVALHQVESVRVDLFHAYVISHWKALEEFFSRIIGSWARPAMRGDHIRRRSWHCYGRRSGVRSRSRESSSRRGSVGRNGRGVPGEFRGCWIRRWWVDRLWF